MAIDATKRIFTNLSDDEATVVDKLFYGYTPFLPDNTDGASGVSSAVPSSEPSTPRSATGVDTLLARLPKIQAQSLDPDEEGDLPVPDETVQKMAHFLRFLASRFSSNRDIWAQSSLSASPAGNLEISWRSDGHSVIFIVKKAEIISVVKKAGEQPERHILSGTIEGSMIK